MISRTERALEWAQEVWRAYTGRVQIGRNSAYRARISILCVTLSQTLGQTTLSGTIARQDPRLPRSFAPSARFSFDTLGNILKWCRQVSRARSHLNWVLPLFTRARHRQAQSLLGAQYASRCLSISISIPALGNATLFEISAGCKVQIVHEF